MKKLKIPSQLLLLTFSIILIASCAFALVTLPRIYSIAEDEVYARLSTYVLLFNAPEDDHNNSPKNFPDMNIEFYVYEDSNNYYYSRNLSSYISNEDLASLISNIRTEMVDKHVPEVFRANGCIKVNNKTLYYVCSTTNSLSGYTIIFTDSAHVTNMIKNVGLQLIVLFFLLILLSSYVLCIWSNRFGKRIRIIQNHISNMSKDNYEKSYVDDSLDEIGELSRTIENMRIEIGHNEKTKQDMLQNLSHDFKTPIAVIKSYAEAQIDGMVGEDSSKIILAQADLLKKKVNRLLQYNSLEYLTKTKEFEDINIKEVILEAVKNYKYQTTLDFELELENEVYFKGYRENYLVVVDNILDNAKRYAKTKIKIVLKPNRLRIFNDGEPISEQFLNGTFKAYEKGAKGEFGLGMSIVKKTLDFFGLDLKVANDPDGVSFIIGKNIV